MGEGQPIRRLLAVCLDESGVLAELEPALHLLRTSLPAAGLALLAPRRPCAHDLPLARVLGLQVDEFLGYPTGGDAEALAALVSEVGQGRFDSALIFTQAGASPYLAAYVCYLAGIPLRLGQSCEFGGGLLSRRFSPQPGAGPARAQFLALASRALAELLSGGDGPPGSE